MQKARKAKALPPAPVTEAVPEVPPAPPAPSVADVHSVETPAEEPVYIGDWIAMWMFIAAFIVLGSMLVFQMIGIFWTYLVR